MGIVSRFILSPQLGWVTMQVDTMHHEQLSLHVTGRTFCISPKVIIIDITIIL